MDTYMHKTMASVASLEKIEIIRSQEFMPSEARQKILKKMIILGPKTAILGPQFCRILVLGPHFWWSGGARAPAWICPWLHSPKPILDLDVTLVRKPAVSDTYWDSPQIRPSCEQDHGLTTGEITHK